MFLTWPSKFSDSEYVYNIADPNLLEFHYNASTDVGHYGINYLGVKPKTRKIFDCLHIRSSQPASSITPGFCVDTETPKTVIDLLNLNGILRHTEKKPIPVLKTKNW